MKLSFKIKAFLSASLLFLLAACSSSGVSEDKGNAYDPEGDTSLNTYSQMDNTAAQRKDGHSPRGDVRDNRNYGKMSFKEASVVHFGFDEYSLNSSEKAKLKVQARYLKENPSKKVTVAGHTDYIGTREYNLALGERRANAVKRYLVSQGIDSSRIETVSYGKSKPLDSDENADARAKNRRTETKVS